MDLIKAMNWRYATKRMNGANAENDYLVRAKKVRREKEKLFVTLP